eukprot:s3404_g3.t1
MPKRRQAVLRPRSARRVEVACSRSRSRSPASECRASRSAERYQPRSERRRQAALRCSLGTFDKIPAPSEKAEVAATLPDMSWSRRERKRRSGDSAWAQPLATGTDTLPAARILRSTTQNQRRRRRSGELRVAGEKGVGSDPRQDFGEGDLILNTESAEILLRLSACIAGDAEPEKRRKVRKVRRQKSQRDAQQVPALLIPCRQKHCFALH